MKSKVDIDEWRCFKGKSKGVYWKKKIGSCMLWWMLNVENKMKWWKLEWKWIWDFFEKMECS